MERDDEAISFAVGVGGAVALGIALIPLRSFTPACNLTLAFVVLTVAIAEWGGRRAAVATALSSALSLDFFLTRPYMTLAIDSKDDVIAFAGLTVCGLVAAAFGSRREKRRGAARHRALVHQALARLEEAGPVQGAVTEALDAARVTLPLAAYLVRDVHGATIAASPGAAARPSPTVALDAATLRPAGAPEAPARWILPREGGRMRLVTAQREVGSLDLWGTGEPSRPEEQSVLADIARVVAARIALTQQS